MRDKLPKGWEWKMLGELGKFIRGVSYKKESLLPEKSNNSITLLRANNIQDRLDLNDLQFLSKSHIKEIQKIKDKDILFCMSSGSKNLVGKNIVLNNLEDFSFGAFCSVFRSINIEYVDYVGYFLKSNEYQNQINHFSQGTNILNLRTNHLEEISFPVPPLSEQKQIVSVLDKTFEKLDQAIALVEQNIQKLKQLNESILDEVLGGENFPRVKIKNVVQKTGQFNPQNNPETEYTYIDISAIDKDIQKITNPNSFIGENAPSRAKKHIQRGDILFATTRPNLKNIALVENEYLNPVASTGFCVLRVNEIIQTNFLFHFLTTQIIQEQIAPLIRGAQYPAISDSDLLGCEIPLPSLSEQQRIVDFLDQTTTKNNQLIQHYQNKLEALKRLKNSVLDSAFKGALRRGKIVSISQPVIDPYIARAKKINAKKKADRQAMIIALSMEAHEKNGKSLYRTKGEKTVEVIEKHLNLDFGREAKKMAAGPAAFEHLVKVVEPLAKEKKWFYTQEIKGENYDGHKYIKAENFNPFMMRTVKELQPNLPEIRRVINLFANMRTTHEAEVIATTYSGWNNLIIRGSQINEEAIVTEARENWHEAKLKIDRQEFFEAIAWLKNNNLVPKGNGNEVN